MSVNGSVIELHKPDHRNPEVVQPCEVGHATEHHDERQTPPLLAMAGVVQKATNVQLPAAIMFAIGITP